MTDSRLTEQLNRLEQASELTTEMAMKLVQQVYQDGIVTRPEAEALFRLNDQLALTDVHWSQRFVEAVKDFLLTGQAPQGWITDAEASWLEAMIMAEGHEPSETEIELVLTLLRQAEGAPDSLGDLALKAIAANVRAEGRVSSRNVERLRRAVCAPAGHGAVWVTREEAVILFEINDVVAKAANHASWNEFFARAIGNHLLSRAHPAPETVNDALRREAWLADESQGIGGFLSSMMTGFSDGSWFEKVMYDPRKAEKARMAAAEAAQKKAEEVTEDESAWFLKRLGWDGRISPAERRLVEFLKAEAPGFVHGLAAAA